ncbi:pancreatic lipase-related protein 2 [Arctopsyche grandis]|uniref:pancreatic lipase-related protein 2 n=1 Tax=Arctopsyche grandis TaxID=121162 RepID=UPI00406D7FD3
MINITSGIMLNTMLLVLRNQNNSQDNSIESQPDIETEKCYGIYGCFSIVEPWVTDNRPISLFPKSPEILKIRYPSFSRHKAKIPYILDTNEPERIKPSRINPAGPFYFISHGYLESGDKLWIEKMTSTLLSLDINANATVISVDWRAGSSPPYVQACANIRLVGTMTAHLIYDIYSNLNLKNLDNFHFIGHSLGAHLGGYAGNVLQTDFGLKLGRITGLDPADPYFNKVANVVRLEKSDAKFVDIVHTDASLFIKGGLGLFESIGHIDYFPNGGSNQPGCNQGMMEYLNAQQGSIFRTLRQFLGCNHIRAYEFFTESISPSCPFLTMQCESYQDFTRGACFKCGEEDHNCLPFGFHSYRGYKRLVESNTIDVSKPLNVFFMTTDRESFCSMHYRITVNISASIESSTHGGDVGRLWMVLISRNGTFSERIPLEEHTGLHKPATQRTLVVSARDIGIPESAKVEWEYETNLLNPLTWRILMSPRVYVAWIHIESLEHRSGITVCPPQESPVIVNTPSYFQQHHCRNLSPIKISTKSRFVF